MADVPEMFANRLAKRRRHLRAWAEREHVTCYRIYDRDIPEVPLTVDWYEGHAVIGDRRHEADDDEWIAAMIGSAARVLEIAPDDVFVKRRERHAHKEGDQYERTGDAGAWFVVHEGAARFHVNLSDYLDTGLFLDHRITRARVAAEAPARKVLNLYCYTAAFTVQAAKGGAASTTSVDLSKTYLDWAGKNLALNELDLRRHELVHADVRAFLRDEAARGARWDLAVVDPPTFSNSKRMDYVLDLERDHGLMLADVARVIAPGGAIWFSTNKRRFALDEDALRGWEIEDLTRRTVPPDFRDATPHRVWRMVPSTRATRA